MERIFGIDLGTTNSLIAYSDNGTPRVIADPETQSPLLPSVVAFPSAERDRRGCVRQSARDDRSR